MGYKPIFLVGESNDDFVKNLCRPKKYNKVIQSPSSSRDVPLVS